MRNFKKDRRNNRFTKKLKTSDLKNKPENAAYAFHQNRAPGEPPQAGIIVALTAVLRLSKSMYA
jgi:hypothetical protein